MQSHARIQGLCVAKLVTPKVHQNGSPGWNKWEKGDSRECMYVACYVFILRFMFVPCFWCLLCGGLGGSCVKQFHLMFGSDTGRFCWGRWGFYRLLQSVACRFLVINLFFICFGRVPRRVCCIFRQIVCELSLANHYHVAVLQCKFKREPCFNTFSLCLTTFTEHCLTAWLSETWNTLIKFIRIYVIQKFTLTQTTTNEGND